LTEGNPFTTAIIVYVPIVALLVTSFSFYLFYGRYKSFKLEGGIALYSFFIISIALITSVVIPILGLGRLLGVFGIFLGSIFLCKFVFKCANCLNRVCLLAITLISLLYSGSFAFTLAANFRDVYGNDLIANTLNIRRSRDMAIALTHEEVVLLNKIAPLIKSVVITDFFTGNVIIHSISLRNENTEINLFTYEFIPINTYKLNYVNIYRNSTNEIIVHTILQDMDLSSIDNITNNKTGYMEKCIFLRQELSYFKSFYYTTIQRIYKDNKILDSTPLQVICETAKS
jgi:hypothetical protein